MLSSWEGGESDDAADSGGFTKFGVSTAFLTDIASTQAGRDVLNSMSQVNENDLQQGVETPVDDEETQFDQGFSLGEDEAEAKGSAENGQEQEANSEGNEAAGSQEPAKADEGKQPNVQNEQPPAAEQPQQPQPQMEQPRESAPAEPEPPKKIEVPENLTEEFATLKKLNPAAAELALEDSPEGERLRSRMEEYGAEMALDRAEVVLDKRNRDVATRKADFERQQQAVQEHNNRFMPLLGYLLGSRFESLITSVDHWVAFILLGLIGGNMSVSPLTPADYPANQHIYYISL